MFVQIIQGKVRDPDLLQRQMGRWRTDVKPGAIGFLGSTSGVTDDGSVVVIARFESEDAARANSERPEQGTWWEATAPAYEGEVTFHDCAEVDVILGGGSDDAGFVQVMQGRAVDPQQMRTAGRAMEDDLHAARPDIIGGIVGWYGDRQFTQVTYFESEEAARKGESVTQDGPEMAEWGKMLDGPITFVDLRHPEYD